MKIVVNASQVAHLWANKSQATAKTPTGNLYFEHDTIFSYGSHFPIASHVQCRALLSDKSAAEKPVRMIPAVLFTVQTSSVTTAGHLCDVRRALHGHNLPVFKVNKVCARYGELSATDHAENFADYISRATSAVKKSEKARERKAGLLQEAENLLREANEYAAAFGLRKRTKPGQVGQLADAARQEAKKQTARQARAEKARAELHARASEIVGQVWPEYLQRWRENRLDKTAFASDCLEGYPAGVAGTASAILSEQLNNRDNPRFRFSRDGRAVESTMGAEVPTRAARKLFAFIREVQAAGREWNPTAEGFTHAGSVWPSEIRAGSFRVEYIKVDGSFRAGCHVVTADEVKAFATLAGWVDSAGQVVADNTPAGWAEVETAVPADEITVVE